MKRRNLALLLLIIGLLVISSPFLSIYLHKKEVTPEFRWNAILYIEIKQQNSSIVYVPFPVFDNGTPIPLFEKLIVRKGEAKMEIISINESLNVSHNVALKIISSGKEIYIDGNFSFTYKNSDEYYKIKFQGSPSLGNLSGTKQEPINVMVYSNVSHIDLSWTSQNSYGVSTSDGRSVQNYYFSDKLKSGWQNVDIQ